MTRQKCCTVEVVRILKKAVARKRSVVWSALECFSFVDPQSCGLLKRILFALLGGSNFRAAIAKLQNFSLRTCRVKGVQGRRTKSHTWPREKFLRGLGYPRDVFGRFPSNIVLVSDSSWSDFKHGSKMSKGKKRNKFGEHTASFSGKQTM